MKELALRVAVMVAAAGIATFASGAARINWTGEGATAAWSDGGNWEGGTAPGLGDIAVLPAGATVGATEADVVYMHAAATKLGGIHFSGDDTVLLITNLTASKTFTVPFTGKGECRFLNNLTSSQTGINMEADNSGYAGSFVISNSPIVYRYPHNGFGTTNKVSYWGSTSGSYRYFTFQNKDTIKSMGLQGR